MKIPKPVRKILKKLEKNNFEAYTVGGCVRDALNEKEPNDWDITTNAKPDQIAQLFLKSFSNNNFGTVTVLTESKKNNLKEIEITPYRIEEEYQDKRHPEKIEWAKTLKKDLSRRDFTINAMAHPISDNISEEKLKDPYNGIKDLKNQIMRAVGDPEERFSEDALRMIRAVRFAVSLSDKPWTIEKETKKAIKNHAHLLEFISNERIKDELIKIVNSKNAARGIELLRRFGLLKNIIPELEEGFGVPQNKHHIYQVYQHATLSLNYACENNYSTEVRLASLLHDIAKPKVKEGKGEQATFYNHEVVGEKMTRKILKRLKFSNDKIKKITKLVRYHLFYYNTDEVSDSSVRRLVRKVGQKNMDKLIQVRKADRIGSGVPKAEPYRLRYMRYVIEKVSRDPISPSMLKVGGDKVMELLSLEPGPKVGKILKCLLRQVLEDPKKNNRKYLEREIVRLGEEVSDKELNRTYEEAKKYINKIKTKRDEMTKKKYWVS